MKKTLLTMLFVLPLAGVALAADDKKDEAKGKAVEYKVHDKGYFEKNNSPLKDNEPAYAAFTTKDDFDKVFGVGFTMGNKENVLAKDAFDTKVVAAAIKRGNALTKYEVEKVTSDDGTLYVQYKAETGDASTAKYASPLIVSVDKAKYKEVVFVENGKAGKPVKFEKEKEKEKEKDK